jgi:hypothetical protein
MAMAGCAVLGRREETRPLLSSPLMHREAGRGAPPATLCSWRRGMPRWHGKEDGHRWREPCRPTEREGGGERLGTGGEGRGEGGDRLGWSHSSVTVEEVGKVDLSRKR